MRAAQRVTATLRSDDLTRLDFIAEMTGLSRNDSVRKALATQAWVDRVLAEGRKVLVEAEDGTIREVV